MTLRIVGIGASAGGLEPVSEILASVAPDAGVAYVVVQHLDRSHGSLLPEILAKHAAIPVVAAVDGQLVEADHAYVITPNTTLTVVDDRLHLTARPTAGERHLPVDALFRSLAAACGENAVAVVLSGGNSDGSLGIQAIKHEGGVVFAQSPESAQVPSMPRHAIETGCVDSVLRPREIAGELARLSSYPWVEKTTPAAEQTDSVARDDDDNVLLRSVLQKVRAAHGVDFTHYKPNMLRRRINRRMMLRGIARLDEYVSLIDTDSAELAALHQDFLIRVTEFFRDPQSFEALRKHVFPTLVNRDFATQPIRIWVPGCATGEEVYSLAIGLAEFLGDAFSPGAAQIFGTDVSEVALAKARAGVYPTTATHGVTAERLQRFFDAKDDQYCIKREIRDLCTFARQDVTRDPPFSRLDLISCRNLLIYLDASAQRRILQVFHFALRPDGMVLFGSAENIGQSTELFEQVDAQVRLYRRLPTSRGGRLAPQSASVERARPDPPVQSESDALTQTADRLLLARFAPASVVVDDGLNVQLFRGRNRRFFEPASGSPSSDLRRVIRPELLVEVLPAIKEARATNLPARREGLRLDDDAFDVSIEVIPMTVFSATGSYLILFQSASQGDAHTQRSSSALSESEQGERLIRLQREVDAMRDYLRNAIEEHGLVTADLKSTHEELLSANEEFQSTNEELETSKEELQATNEELTTTVEELRAKNRELGTLNAELARLRVASDRSLAYADIIIETVREPLLVLDKSLKVQRVNQSFVAEFGVSGDDVEDRLLYEVQDGLWDVPELRTRLNAVAENGQAIENWELTRDVPRRGRRVLSLNARPIPGDAERVDLLLLGVEDITDRAKVAADLLEDSRRKDEFLATLAHELRHPLTPIAHAIHLLRKGQHDAATTELYETIDTEAARLLRFVNELLDVARINRSLIQVTRERVDLVAVVREAIAGVQPLFQSRRHRFIATLPDAPVFVSGDSGRLNQAVTNLLENAANYTQPGGEITLTLKQHGNEVVLSVRDNGIGIAPEYLERIFDLFTQANPRGGFEGGGLGLGLSIVRKVLQLHGGSIVARSAGVNAGSEFIARLPVPRELRAPEAPAEQPRGQRSSGKRAVAPCRRVLVVDDHQRITDSLARLIRSWGHEVAVANDATSALALVESFHPDCAILDIAMPNTNGYQLAQRLRESFPPDRLRLIAFTGYGGPEVRAACHSAGFDTCIVKPGDVEELEALFASDFVSSDAKH